MPVPFLQLLTLLEPDLNAADCKVHLAAHNGQDNPLDLFVDGTFDAWQLWQSKANFNRDNVIALIALPERDRWLFAGVYRTLGFEQMDDGHYEYNLKSAPEFASFDGRVVVHFARPGRQSYLLAENWAEQMNVSEIRPERYQVAGFPGYSRTTLTKRQLDLVTKQQIPSWKAALSSVGGVYLITDSKTGKLYVGSATGEGGIWNRWCDYSSTGHGDNRGLRQLLSEHGAEYADHFQFGILEIADSHASPEDTLERESHWKRLLLSREYGYNEN